MSCHASCEHHVMCAHICDVSERRLQFDFNVSYWSVGTEQRGALILAELLLDTLFVFIPVSFYYKNLIKGRC